MTRKAVKMNERRNLVTFLSRTWLGPYKVIWLLVKRFNFRRLWSVPGALVLTIKHSLLDHVCAALCWANFMNNWAMPKWQPLWATRLFMSNSLLSRRNKGRKYWRKCAKRESFSQSKHHWIYYDFYANCCIPKGRTINAINVGSGAKRFYVPTT